MPVIERRLFVATTAVLLQAALYALVLEVPGHRDWFVLLIPFMLPGIVLQFFLGGGMSMVDGVSPEWRADFAFAPGFLLNTVIMYCFCLLVRKLLREISPIFRTR